MTKMTIITVFVGYTTVDEWGRKGSMVGIYRTHDDAKVGVQKQGWYGSEGRIEEKKAIEIGLDLYIVEEVGCFVDVTKQREEQKRQELARIKAKLTPAELEVLTQAMKGEKK